MELLFLALLFGLMIWALTSGFPVAFALPGSAIISIGLAALCGYLFADDPSAYFAEGGPSQWLSAGVTNFRSLYWIVERDTLIAIPLFIFMGIMLQRSRIAEDLLVAMAQLFGPLPSCFCWCFISSNNRNRRCNSDCYGTNLTSCDASKQLF